MTTAGRPTLTTILAREGTNTGRYLARRLTMASPLFQMLPFDDSVSPNARQGSLQYGYTLNKSLRTGQLRDFNTDYTAKYTESEVKTAVLRPMGDAFEIDRVFADSSPDYVQENVDGFGPAIVGKFNDLAINGDNSVNSKEITGLSKLLTGTTSEIDGTTINLASGQTDSAYYDMLAAVKKYVNRLKGLGFTPMILTNEDAALRLETIGLKLGYVARATDQFGADITRFGGAQIVDAGAAPSDTDGDWGGKAIIPVVTKKTDIYIVGLGLNGFHGVTLTGGKAIRYYQTAKTDAGAVQRYEAELVAGVALQDTRAAYVLRGVTVSN